MWLIELVFPQFCKSVMSKYGYLEVFQRIRDNKSRLYEPRHSISYKIALFHQAKTQISLRICAVWQKYLQDTLWVGKDLSVFAGRTCNFIGNAVSRLVCILIYDILRSVSYRYEPGHNISYKTACASSNDIDQSAYPRSLIRVFAGRSVGIQESKASSSGQRRLMRLRGCQADLSLHWSRNLVGNAVPRFIWNSITVFILNTVKPAKYHLY